MKVVTLHRWQVVASFVALTASFVAVGVILTAQQREIQHQRRDTILRNCADQNERHDETISTLRRLAAKIIRERPSEAQRIRESIADNILLINALVPKRNCEALAEKAVP